jgi:CBS domain-containing protein
MWIAGGAMKAQDIMQPLTEHLKPTDTLSEAARLLRTARRCDQTVGVKALPVCDETGQLVGILSIGDILKAVYPPYMYLMELGEFAWDGMVESFARKAGEKKVGDIMTRSVVTVREDATLMMCVDHMLKNNVKRVPVLDADNEVLGMLYERDIFYAITEAMLDRTGKEGA